MGRVEASCPFQLRQLVCDSDDAARGSVFTAWRDRFCLAYADSIFFSNRHFWGTRFAPKYSSQHSATSARGFPSSTGVSPSEPPASVESKSPHSEASADDESSTGAVLEEPIVAKVSYHVLREERVFHMMKNLLATADPNQDHIIKPLELLRLTPQPGDRGQVVVAIYQDPGENILPKIMNMGPAYYYARKVEDRWTAHIRENPQLESPIKLNSFLDFAIGAAQCLEMIHHGVGIIHGEIRGDSFHFIEETAKVKLVIVGSGLRSFEHGLTSTGWSSLSKEIGAKNKLLYISPEQTGRMPAEPDARTDIYSLGVLFWTLLTQQPVFDGDTPLDIVQGVLGKRIPIVSDIRLVFIPFLSTYPFSRCAGIVGLHEPDLVSEFPAVTFASCG